MASEYNKDVVKVIVDEAVNMDIVDIDKEIGKLLKTDKARKQFDKEMELLRKDVL